MSKYNFAKGVVVKLSPLVVQMGNGLIVRQKLQENGNWVPRLNQQVIASWSSTGSTKNPRKFRGEYYIDDTAIEPIGLWSRISQFRRIHYKDEQSLPFIAEEVIANVLESNGIRAEKATNFEDEKLGVDLWIFLKSGDIWKWYPIDITLRRDTDVHRGEKFDKGFQRGIITISLDPKKVEGRSSELFSDFFTAFNAGCENFNLCGKKTFSRREAKKQEECFSQSRICAL